MEISEPIVACISDLAFKYAGRFGLDEPIFIALFYIFSLLFVVPSFKKLYLRNKLAIFDMEI